MRILATSALFVLCTTICSRAEPPHGVSAPLWDAALGALLLRDSDLGFQTDYVAVDAARLAAVNKAMEQPQLIPGWLGRQPLRVFDFGLAADSGSPGDVPLWQIAAPRINSGFQKRLPPRSEAPKGLPRSFGPLVSAVRAAAAFILKEHLQSQDQFQDISAVIGSELHPLVKAYLHQCVEKWSP